MIKNGKINLKNKISELLNRKSTADENTKNEEPEIEIKWIEHEPIATVNPSWEIENTKTIAYYPIKNVKNQDSNKLWIWVKYDKASKKNTEENNIEKGYYLYIMQGGEKGIKRKMLLHTVARASKATYTIACNMARCIVKTLVNEYMPELDVDFDNPVEETKDPMVNYILSQKAEDLRDYKSITGCTIK